MEYKVNIKGLPGVDLYADKESADRLIAAVAPAKDAAPFVKGQRVTFANNLVEVRKAVAKKVVKKVTAKKATKKVAKKKVPR